MAAEDWRISEGKMAAAGAVSLVDEAWRYGAVSVPHKNMLLEKIGNLQADLDRIECRLIEGDFHFDHRIRCLFEDVKRGTVMFRDAVVVVDNAIHIHYHRLEEEVGNLISKFANNLARFDIPGSSLKRLRNTLGTLQEYLDDSNFFVSAVSALASAPSDAPAPKIYVENPSQLATDPGFFGRHCEKERLLQWLTNDTAQDNAVSVCAVVGMAGMGKSTLANIVCQDPRVSTKFQAVVWVPVSVDFNIEAMVKVILESITGRPPAYSSMFLLQKSLTETLRYRKVLVILDNVWEDNSVEKWQTLVDPLKVCKKGSRVLLTTRMQSVVDMASAAIGTAAEYLKLDDLDEYDSLMLLKSRLPSQVANNLMLIAEQILKKIGGCPLVINLVASWLGSHMETHHWIALLQKGWQHIEEKNIIIESFRLSYNRIPNELQACFSYCSLFTKGYKFNKGELSKMWSGSGLIPFSSSKQENIGIEKTKHVNMLSAEYVGEEYFDTLARKSFFCCMLEKDPSTGDQNEYYVLHSLMHDFAKLVSRLYCTRMDNPGFPYVCRHTQHLSVSHGSNLRRISVCFKFLHTLIITNEFCPDEETDHVLGSVLQLLRQLRLLYLDVPSLFHALDGLSNLTQLRYLLLFSCDESHLHKVFKLHHLQVFKLKHFTVTKGNSIHMHNLRCLHCLDVPDNMSSKIHQIGKLTSLQELHGFDMVKNYFQRSKSLGDVRSLFQLSLRNLQNVSDCEEAMEIKLKDKHHMEFLSMSWNKDMKEILDHDDQVIDNLEPNKEIRRLHIHGYDGVNLPFWIENSTLIHLVSLELEYCMKWKSLPSLQELNSLKHLKLENLFQLEYIGTEPELQLETDESEDAWLPPFLSTLKVRWCPNLKQLPAIPCTLELLMIKHVHLASLPRIHQRYTGARYSQSVKSQLSFLHIESCPHLTSLNKGLLEQQEQLHSLTTLSLRHCERLHHLPTRGFAELHRLTSLEVVACPILRDVNTRGSLLPTSLMNLDVNPCGDTEASILMALQNLSALRRLTLFNCSNIEELPSVKVFGTLNNLIDVSICRCKNLISLGAIGAVASLRKLSILCCDKISFSHSPQDGCCFKLQKLRIDRQALLLMEPLRSLRHTKELQIGDDYAMESLPEEWLLQNAASLHSIEIGVAEALRSLPSEMKKLGSLQNLHIERAQLIQSLPQLPASLRKLAIWGCNTSFLKRYGSGGEDWGKIAHIAAVDIKAYSEGTYYGDDQSQDFINSNSSRPFIMID